MLVLERNVNRMIALFMALIMLFSCTMGLSGPKALSDRELVSRSSRLIGLYLEDLENLDPEDLEAEIPGFGEELGMGFSPEDVATRTLEEGGRDYLEFCVYADDYQSVEEVLDAAEPLVGDEDLSQLREDAKRAENLIYEAGEEAARVLTNQEREAFYKDLSRLVIQSVVLLTAAIVYACSRGVGRYDHGDRAILPDRGFGSCLRPMA